MCNFGFFFIEQITIDQTKVDANLAGFPVLIHLSPSSGPGSAVLSAVFGTLGSNANREKIAVTTADGVSQCFVEIEKWDNPARQAWLWVNVPALSGSADTTLYLYYDAAHADNTARVGDTGSSPAQSVWDSGYKAVYHLEDSGSTILGSTRYGHNGSRLGGGGSTYSRIGDGGATSG